jgi:hypothetical protein
MSKTLLNIRTGVAKEINIDCSFWHRNTPMFADGVEFVCHKNRDESRCGIGRD